MDAKSLARRINESGDVDSHKETLASICKELCELLDKCPSAPGNEDEDEVSDTDAIKLALPKLCERVLSGKTTVEEFANLIADAYNAQHRWCLLNGIDGQ